MPAEYRLLYRGLFYSGCRIGEYEALEPRDFREKFLDVREQITEERKRRPPKGGKPRKTFLPPAGRPFLQVWCSLDPEQKRRLRQARHNLILGTACQKVFPNQPEKWCTPHDLRHSYAIYLLAKGHRLALVAQSMGDTIAVCEEYYSGYELTPSGIEAMEAVEA